jgi:hypothetical protein
VRVHTVFLGLGACPEILETLARETGGVCFLGRPGPDGALRLRPAGDSRLRLRPTDGAA